MTFFSLKQWSNQFDNPKVLARIRRKIAGIQAGGECVIVQLHDVEGLTPEVEAELQRDWAPSKVRFSRTFNSDQT
jgi:hypothetical protein